MSESQGTKTSLTPAQQFLNDVWEQHLGTEFATRDSDARLDTKAPRLVNHIPVLTGGFGRAELPEFRSRHFIPKMPPDTQIVPLSRTIDTDRLVDEIICRFSQRDGLNAPGHRSHRPTSRVRAGGHRSFSRWQTWPRTYLFGTKLRSWCNSDFSTHPSFPLPAAPARKNYQIPNCLRTS
jgi:hypothetical protein